jgi:DNA end-binding protein Ku
MHPIWSGVIGFGLVNIPVRLYSPAREEVLDLDFLHKKDRSPIRYARICKEEEKEIAWDDIERGYKVGKKGYVVLTPKDFAKADARKTKAIDILHFADASEIDPIFFEKPYYLEPEAKAGKAFQLLRRALEEAGKVGVATFVLRHRENLAVIRPYKNGLVLDQLRYSHEMAPLDELKLPAKDAPVSKKELKIAADLIAASTERFKPDVHKDRYLKALQAIIKEKARGKIPKARGKAPVPTKSDDLMAQLKRSLAHHARASAHARTR